MGFKSGVAGLAIGFISGFVAMGTLSELMAIAFGVVVGALVARGVKSGLGVGILLGLSLPSSLFLISVTQTLIDALLTQNVGIETLTALLLVVMRLLNQYNLIYVVGGAVLGAIFGLIGKKLFTGEEEEEE